MIATATGGTQNHVHVLFPLSPKLPLAKSVQLMKGNSSKWIGEQAVRFAWQDGHGAFSVSSSNLDQVAAHIRNQEAHHCNFSFEEEFRALLKKHGVEFDSRYVVG